MNLDEKIKAILAHTGDGAFTFVTQGKDGPHLAATWNSYVTIQGNDLLIPAGGMNRTQSNLSGNDSISLIVACRQVQGLNGDGAGYHIEGKAVFLDSGPDVDAIKGRFPWARGMIRITPTAARQIA